jgi:hypothetical protein
MEVVNLEEHRQKRKEKPGVFACGECGVEDWNIWTDGVVTCSACGCLAENVYVRPSPVRT